MPVFNPLETVKSMLGITGNYQDATLQYYIDEVKQYLADGGVSQKIINAPTSAGIIARGVVDLWNYGAGVGKLSSYFMERAVQLAVKSKSSEESEGGTNDYNELINKPQIEGVELIGNMTLDQLNIQPKIAEKLEEAVAIEDPVIAPKIIAQEIEAENLYTNVEIDEMIENIEQEIDSISTSEIDNLMEGSKQNA